VRRHPRPAAKVPSHATMLDPPDSSVAMAGLPLRADVPVSGLRPYMSRESANRECVLDANCLMNRFRVAKAAKDSATARNCRPPMPPLNTMTFRTNFDRRSASQVTWSLRSVITTGDRPA
jgi:hypothetical protein